MQRFVQSKHLLKSSVLFFVLYKNTMCYLLKKTKLDFECVWSCSLRYMIFLLVVICFELAYSNCEYSLICTNCLFLCWDEKIRGNIRFIFLVNCFFTLYWHDELSVFQLIFIIFSYEAMFCFCMSKIWEPVIRYCISCLF